jgi:hypothetical protein
MKTDAKTWMVALAAFALSGACHAEFSFGTPEEMAGTGVGQDVAPEVSSSTAPVQIDEMLIKGLKPGVNISVFFVNGFEGAVSMQGQALNVRSVKRGPIELTVNSAGEVTTPKITVESAGGFLPLNYVVGVLHTGPRIFLKSYKGEVLADDRGEARQGDEVVNDRTQTFFIQIAELKSLRQSLEHHSLIVIDMAHGLR